MYLYTHIYVFEPHPMVFSIYSQCCIQKSLLVELEDHIRCLGFNPRFSAYKKSAILTVPSLQS